PPDVSIPYSTVWVGAMGTALVFTLGKYLLALYLGRASTASPYGAAGSVIIALMWIYYGSVILFFGAEFTHVFTRQTGARIVPAHYAVAVTVQERARQGMSTEHKGQKIQYPSGELQQGTPQIGSLSASAVAPET